MLLKKGGCVFKGEREFKYDVDADGKTARFFHFWRDVSAETAVLKSFGFYLFVLYLFRRPCSRQALSSAIAALILLRQGTRPGKGGATTPRR